LVVPYRYPEIIASPDRPMTLRQLLATSTTTSNAIEYVEEVGFENNVEEEGFENNASVVPETQDKPQSELSFYLKTESVKTIAHWIPASRQILADAPQLRGYVDQRLIYGLNLAEEQEILYGTGGANLQGIMTHQAIQNYQWSQGQPGDTKIDAIRRAITLARVAEYPVTGIVLHPKDWEEIELAKGSDGRYIWVSVTEGGQSRLWRVPVVDTTAIQVGECLLGAFRMGAMLWDREQTTIRVAEQHEDFFVKNMVAILAEERIALTIFRPQAFVAVKFNQAPQQSS